jgi:hypothetical protein
MKKLQPVCHVGRRKVVQKFKRSYLRRKTSWSLLSPKYRDLEEEENRHIEVW